MVRWFMPRLIRATLVSLFMAIAPSCAEAEGTSESVLPAQARRSTEGTGSGYRKFEQLEPIHAALAADRYQDALDAATAIIETPDGSFPTEKQARVIKANAHLLRSDARLGLQEDNELVLRDEKAAASLGLRHAAYRAATQLAIMASERAATPFERIALLAKAENYYRMAAELGDKVSMDFLSDVILRQRGEDAERMYWSFQVQLSRPLDQLGEMLKKFGRAFTSKFRASAKSSMSCRRRNRVWTARPFIATPWDWRWCSPTIKTARDRFWSTICAWTSSPYRWATQL